MRQELLNVFLATHDDAAIVLTSIVFDLAQHPAVWARLREEVLGLGDAPVTFEGLKSLTYLRWAVNERIPSKIQADNPQASASTPSSPTTPAPASAASSSPPAAAPRHNPAPPPPRRHRQHEHLRATPAHRPLRPRRRPLPPRALGHAAAHLDFVPFGGGPRHCPAQQLARSEIRYVLARLARGFQGVECRDPVGEFVEEVRLTFESFHWVKVGLIPA